VSGTHAGSARPVGDRAWIVDLPDLDGVLALTSRLRALADPEIVDIVPAARTVLVVCADRTAARRLAAEAEGLAAEVRRDPGRGIDSAAEREVRIDTIYDGEDIATVAALTGLAPETVISAHTGSSWRAAFGGFAPGFVYLSGGDPRLIVPRLSSPRTSVPTGAVAIADEFSAVYPGASPGGWRLLGRALAPVWDVTRASPALIQPGDTVRFRAVRESVRMRANDAASVASVAPAAPVATESETRARSSRALTVIRPGMLTLVQDFGRHGHAALGVTGAGALDRAALARANRAVGNAPGAAGLEVLAGGIVLRAEQTVCIAVAGAQCELRIEAAGGADDSALSRVAETDRALMLRAGEQLTVGRPFRGLRSYVALRGGIAGGSVLGSLAHDTLSGLGVAPLRAGDGLSLIPMPDAETPADGGSLLCVLDTPQNESAEGRSPAEGRNLGGAGGEGSHADEGSALRFVPGPRDDWFDPASLVAFEQATWVVSPRSNRVGLRLEGPPLARARSGELPTEGMVAGSVQVPPDGLPVLFLADHPTTGGYPVIGTVIDADLDRAAQLPPGAEVRFVAVDPDDPGELPVWPQRLPDTVAFAIEIDGLRRQVRVPGVLAAALDRARVEGDHASAAAFWEELLRSLARDAGGDAVG